MSYVPQESAYLVKIGRMNGNASPMYYGSLITENTASKSIITVLSEIKAEKNKIYNILFSQVIGEIVVIPIGVFDYFRRGIDHPFKKNMHPNFEAVYKYYEENLKGDSILPLYLCDAFLNDVLRKKGSERLYKITSAIANECLSISKADGIVYPSVEFIDHPNIVLKPEIVDKKIQHKKAYSIYLEESYGYGMYKLTFTHCGETSFDKIQWRKVEPKDFKNNWFNVSRNLFVKICKLKK